MSGPVTSRGFTLIELMIVLALLAIVAFIAVPNFTDFIERNQSVVLKLQGIPLLSRGIDFLLLFPHAPVLIVDMRWCGVDALPRTE